MGDLLAPLALLLAVILYRHSRSKHRQLEMLIEQLKLRVHSLEQFLLQRAFEQRGSPSREPLASTAPATSPTPPPAAAASAVVAPPAPAQPAASLQPYLSRPPALPPTATAPPIPTPLPPPLPPKEKHIPAWRRAVTENWTGFLGAVITVAGVAFFGVYASFHLGPLGRFAMINGFAALLLVASRLLQRSPLWRLFGSWLQAIAGAVVLLACLGAGSFERLKFITDARIALGVLSAGILLNLLFAYLTPDQAVASVHVLLSLVALAIPDQGLAIFALATLVTSAGILLSYRSRWDINLLVILIAYAAFHHAWLARIALPAADVRSHGIAASLLIGASAALVHYRQKYRSPSFEWLPFTVHLVNWGTLGMNLLQHSRGSNWATVFLAAAAAAATLLARRARTRGIRWLYVTDTLTGQLLMLLAISRLGRVGVTNLDLAMLAYAEVLAFLVMCNLEGERLLLRFGYGAQWLAAGVVLLFVSDDTHPSLGALNLPVAYRLGLVALATFVYLLWAARKAFVPDDLRFLVTGREPSPDRALSVLTFAVFAFVLLAHVLTYRVPASPPIAAVVLLFLCWHRGRHESRAAGIACAAALFALHVLHALAMRETMGEGSLIWLRYFAPLAVLDLLLLLRSLRYARWQRLVVYLFTAHVAMGVYALTSLISDFVPGVAYLVLSLLALEAARTLRRVAMHLADQRLPDHVLHGGWFFLALFIGRHLVVHLQSESSLGLVSIRLAIGVFALAVVAYWLGVARSFAHDTLSPANRVLTPLLAELWLGLLALTIALECETVWQPVAWAALSILLVVLVRAPSRLHAYAWISDLASAIQLGFVSSTFATPRPEWYARSHYVGPIAIALQLLFVGLFYRRRLWSPVTWPSGLAWCERAHHRTLERHPDAWVFYPLVFCVAVFLYWRFDKAVLTLLWVIEIFLVFALGVFLRQRHFVHVANGALILCIGRLVLYDLAKTDVSVRAVVFVSVGLLMLGINAMYRKYRDRIGTWPK